MSHLNTRGFTLLEISIVLVIIGLITGSIMYGLDLKKSAGVVAQVSQISKYNAAVNTFNAKYGALPGDIGGSAASQAGLLARTGDTGRGNADNLLEGMDYPDNQVYGWAQEGETLLFWEDLSQMNYIDGTFNTATTTGTACCINGGNAVSYTGSSPVVGNYLPQAKIGQGNYIYVYSTYSGNPANNPGPGDGNNYYGLSAVTQLSGDFITSGTGLSTFQAYNIDKKIDDGLPTTGVVQANYLSPGVVASTNSTTPSTKTCYDTTSYQYSTSQAGIANNCALSFQFQ